MTTLAATTRPEITALAARHISDFAVRFFLFLENRDERRRQRAFAQQPPEQVRDGEGELERAGDPAGRP